MEGRCLTGQSPQLAAVSMEEEEEVLHSKLDNGHSPKKENYVSELCSE